MKRAKGKPRISAEWTVCDNEGEWEREQTLEAAFVAEPVRKARFPMRRIWWATALAALLLLAVSGAWLWRSAQSGLKQIDAEVRNAVDQELWISQEGRDEAAATAAGTPQNKERQSRLQQNYALWAAAVSASITNESSDYTLADLEIVSLYAEKALVRVVIVIGEEKYRQTRPYQREEEGWVQIPAELGLLGEVRHLELDHLSIDYFELDAAAVAEVAPRLDAFAAQIWTDFGLPMGKKQAIQVTSDRDLMRRAGIMDEGQSTMYVASPALSLLPAKLSEGNALLQFTALQLVHPLLQEALDQYNKLERNCAWRWLPLLIALRNWEFWESGAPLASSKDEIVELLMGGKEEPERAILYEGICHKYRVWNLSPMSMSIPLRCQPATRAPTVASKMPDTLQALLEPSLICSPPDEMLTTESHDARLTTLLDYSVATFGRQRLPVLVGALGKYGSWDRLIPAVFGVSLAEFERGWRAYLQEQYTVVSRPN